jgi:hypothetical protein
MAPDPWVCKHEWKTDDSYSGAFCFHCGIGYESWGRMLHECELDPDVWFPYDPVRQ